MARRSRRGPRTEGRPSQTSGAGTERAGTERAGTERPMARPLAASTTRRTRPARRTREAGPFERYRGLIVGGAAALGLVIVGFFLLQSTARGGWECASLLTPGPAETLTPRPSILATPSPSAAASGSPDVSPSAGASGSPAASAPPAPSPAATSSASPGASPSPEASASPEASPSASPSPPPDPTPRLGFTTADMARRHVLNPGQTLRYGFCPPTSGEHFNIAGQGPIRPLVYPPSDARSPGSWIHNLEHGYVVAAYRCTGPDDCPSAAELAELQRFYDEAPDSEVAACADKVLVVRLDDMTTRFAVLAWNRALLMDEFDVDMAKVFAEQWMDHEAAPERGACL